ncbi:MAG: hypothetical protein MUP85_21250 [Candidatus Lokiarchaeota archaeon]|nr:hypothetical protein [Candidatus Lokiarchaeota archaeon]
MDLKLYKKTYRYICSSCRKFTHTEREYCESCGAKGTIIEASKQDYEKLKT